jgi:uncharacterized pyridoxamine 5'-phosphate oxidase family protein
MADVPPSHADLLAGGTVSLSTIGPDGYPQVTAIVAVLLEDGLIHTSLNTRRQKLKNLAKNPRCTLLAIDPAVHMRTLEIRAEAELLDDPDRRWSKDFLKGVVDLDTIDAPGDERKHVVFRPVKVNTLSPGAF